jgi:AraC-like DNA-binding protein
MEIKQARHDWPEEADFHLSRPNGAQEYVLLHFHNSVELSFRGRRYVTQPGALILFSPGEPHGFVSREPLLHDWMHLTGPVREEAAAFGIAPDTLYQPGCGVQITELVARLEAEFFARRSHWQALAQALMTELWVLLCRDLTRETPAPVALETADRLRALRAQMLLHPELPWDNATMARQINLSVSRLYPLYRRMFALSPNRDLILIRVEKAKNMLLQGETVARTAACLGYANVSHFNRQFKQVTRVPPGRYGQAERKP